MKIQFLVVLGSLDHFTLKVSNVYSVNAGRVKFLPYGLQLTVFISHKLWLIKGRGAKSIFRIYVLGTAQPFLGGYG